MSVYGDIFNETVQEIRNLALPGLPDDRVIVWPIPDARTLTGITLPCVCVGLTAEPEVEAPAHSTNLRDGMQYPIGIYTVHRPEPGKLDYTAEIEESLTWRQMIRRRFSRTGNVAGGIVGGIDQTITPVQAIDPATWVSQGMMIGGLVLRVVVREERNADA